MAAAFVAERAKHEQAGAASPTQAVSGTTNGNLLTIGFCFAGMVSGTGSLTSVTDTGSNSWSVVASGAIATTTRPGLFIAYSFLTAAPDTITMNTSGGANSNGLSWKIEEFSGLGSFDVASAGHSPAGNATSLTTNSATPAGAGELAVCCASLSAAQSSVTAGSGYTIAGTVNNSGSPEPAFEYNLSAGSGSQTASLSWGTSTTEADQLAFFQVPSLLLPVSVHLQAVMRSNSW